MIPESGRSPGERNGSEPSILAWRTPWTEEPGGPQATGGLIGRETLMESRSDSPDSGGKCHRGAEEMEGRAERARGEASPSFLLLFLLR